MSPSPPNPPVASSDLARLQRELAEKTELVQRVRQELILAQITVLELQDTLLQKETDKADAVSILGQAELVLESKINYIFELDRVLNEQIADLKKSLAAAEATRDALTAQLAAAHAAHAQDRAARDAIARDLAQKLDEANRALGAAHALAGGYARTADETNATLAATAAKLAATTADLAASELRLRETERLLSATEQRLQVAESSGAALRHELDQLHRSFVWRLTAPLRPLGRRKP